MTLTLRPAGPVRHLPRPASMLPKTIKVLLLVDDCDPLGTPDERLGYELSRALARTERLDVVIATHERNRQVLAKQPIDAGRGRLARVEFIESARLHTRLRRLGTVFQRFSTILNEDEPCDTSAAATGFDRDVYRRFKNELAQGRFDVVHRLKPGSPSVPWAFPGWTDIPTLIGPVLNSHIKPISSPDCANPLNCRHPRSTTTLASRNSGLAAIIAGSRETLVDLGDEGPRRFFLPEANHEPERFPMVRSWPAPVEGEAFHFITSGRLVPETSIDWVIRAMATSPVLRESRLTVFGEGPELANLTALARELGLGSAVEFRGWLDDRAIKSCLAEAQAFVFPSETESDGGMIVQAMSAGLPVIVRDSGESRTIVDHSYGIRLPRDHSEGVVNSIRQTMERLAIDHELCERLGKAGSRRARERFSWPAKAAMVRGFYENIIDSKSNSDRF